MAQHLQDLEIAHISENNMQKLLDAEKEINSQESGNQEEIYLLAFTKTGR